MSCTWFYTVLRILGFGAFNQLITPFNTSYVIRTLGKELVVLSECIHTNQLIVYQ